MARHDRFRRSEARRVLTKADQALSLEGLEARLLLTAYVVDTPLDVVDTDGFTSLREALTAANTNVAFSDVAAGTPASTGVDTITFAPELDGETLQLLLGELSITEAVSITASAAPDNVTIDASGEMRIFNVTGNNVTLTNLVLTHGLGLGGGGAIRMSGGGTLNIVDCTIEDSFASSAEGSPAARGGGILNLGSTINISTTTDPTSAVITGNGAVDGGGIYSVGGTINLFGVDVSDNTASRRGAGIYMDGGTLNLRAASTGVLAAPVMVPTTISGNTAATLGGGVFADEATVNSVGATIGGTGVGNTALDGGGVYLTGSQANFGVLVNTRGVVLLEGGIIDNTAQRNGGGLFMTESEVDVAGGGILIPLQGTPDLGRVAITGNTAVNGGGIYQERGTLSLEAAAVSDNTTTSTPLVGVAVSMDGTVAATADATGKVTGTITGTVTVGGVTGPSGSLGTFTATTVFASDTVTITVTLNSTTVGTFDCTLTLAPDATTADPNDYTGTFGGAGVVIGSGSATFTGSAAADDPNGLAVTMSTTATLSGPSAVPSTGLGAGIYGTHGTTTSKNLWIRGNTAGAGASPLPVMGGGIYALYHHLNLDSTIINDNTAEGNGGGVFLEHSTATFSQVTLGGNIVTTDPVPTPDAEAITGGVSGGAIGFGTINATFSGGGTAAQPLLGSVRGIGTGSIQGIITVNGLIVGVVTGTVTVSPMGTGNITGSVASFGSGTGVLTATIYGGGLTGTIGGTVTLAGAGTMPTTGLGGGVYVTQGSGLKLKSSTLSENSAVIGGGLYVAFPAPIGSGVFADEGGDVESESSIITANSASAGNIGPDVYGVITSGRTLIGRGAGAKVYGSDNLVGRTVAGIDAKLDVQDVNGRGFYDLLPGSPAINAGTNPAGESTDTRGWPRLFGAKYDMGAVEHQADSGPRIDLEIDNRDHVQTYNFGSVPIGTSKTVVFTIRNEGTNILTINFVTRANALLPTVFSQSPGNSNANGDDWQILPGQTLTFTVRATPTLAIPDMLDTYFLGSNDSTRPVQPLAVTVNQGPPVPDMQASGVSVVEGNSGTKNVVFTVTLSSPSASTVTAQYTTADGLAVAGLDYIPVSGLLTFAPGQTSRTITVKVKGDKIDELDETFFLDLSNALGAAILGQPPVAGDTVDHTHQAVATIIDDDAAPTVRIGDARVVEGNAGLANLVYTASLSNPSGKTVTVDYATSNGTALAGSDYTAQANTLTFAPGVVTQTITIAVKGDTTYEFDETLFVNLSNASNATIAGATGKGTIVNDDAAPILTIDSPSVVEGTGGSTFLDFTVSLSQPSERPVTALYATAKSPATLIVHPATPGLDFLSASGTVVFAPGDTDKTISISIVTDALDEFDEQFLVKLSKVTGATVGVGTGTGTILDDDAMPDLFISDATVVEGDSGFRKMVFTVTLSDPSGRTVEVNYATSPNTAATPSDFITKTGTLTFAPGETSKTLFVLVRGDTVVEPNETLFVDLSAPSFATIADGHGVGTIVDDDF